MASTKLIKAKISSIKNTKKITGAMELVAASKMKKSQAKAIKCRPYSEAIRPLLRRVSGAEGLASSPYVVEHKTKVKRNGYILISSDRGLCGGLNGNLFRFFLNHLNSNNIDYKSIKTCSFGRKGSAFLKRVNVDVGLAMPAEEKIDIKNVVASIGMMLELYKSNEIDNIYIVYNHFVNNMIFKPTTMKLLPLKILGTGKNTNEKNH